MFLIPNYHFILVLSNLSSKSLLQFFFIFLYHFIGSSVATSLCDGESVEKHVAILKIQGKKFDLQKIKLRTVRPFVFETAKLAEWNMKLPTKKMNEAVSKIFL